MFNNIDFSKFKPIVVLPDFFIDRIIQLKSKEHFFESILQKTKYGGGSIREFNAIEKKEEMRLMLHMLWLHWV